LTFTYLGPIPKWHHVGCFKKILKEIDWRPEYSVTMIPGFSAVDKADQETVKNLIKVKKSAKKVKEEPEIKKEVKEVDQLQIKLKAQNKKLWAIKDWVGNVIFSSVVACKKKWIIKIRNKLKK
jgi:hypothetical protein